MSGRHFLCLITPLCSYLYGGLYGWLYERAHIIRYFLTRLHRKRTGANVADVARPWEEPSPWAR
jgi:hypothetical protein